jgi:hypothetical protein
MWGKCVTRQRIHAWQKGKASRIIVIVVIVIIVITVDEIPRNMGHVLSSFRYSRIRAVDACDVL